jgi:uncharacterized Zn finger protein
MLIPYPCPGCGLETGHHVLKEGAELLVECSGCGYIHRIRFSEPAEIRVKAIISDQDRSRVCDVELGEDEEVAVGDHLAALCGNEAAGVEVTAIESGGKRVQRAQGASVGTLWTRAIERVVVKVSVHRGRTTEPLRISCTGDQEFSVGGTATAGRTSFRISHMKLRDGHVVRREGKRAAAREITRVYGYRL